MKTLAQNQSYIDSNFPVNFPDIIEECGELVTWHTDSNFAITSVNQTLFDLTGYLPEEVIGKKLNDFLSVENPESWDELIHSETEFHNIRFKMKSANEVYIYFTAHGKILRQNNRITGYTGIFVIETTKVLTKRAIKRLQTTNKAILDSLSEALVIIDNNEQFLVISPEFNEMWGFKKGEIYILSLQEIHNAMLQKLSDSHKSVPMCFTCQFDSPQRTKDILRFKDGRIIERRSTPLIRNNQMSGTCWYFKDITENNNLLKRLGNLAFRDSLTNLYNRRWCEKKLKQYLISPEIQNLAFMYMDLDYFKVINDSCGHIHGDDVLAEISQLLLKTIGNEALLSRLGGDEFGLILLHDSKQQVIQKAIDILDTVGKFTYQWHEKIFKLGISIGVAFVAEKEDFRSIFIRADEACYISKKTGKHKYTVYDADSKAFQQSQSELKWYSAI